jgi:hypothetical protein
MHDPWHPVHVAWDDALTGYDFGPGHPMSPVRLDLTIRLAREMGVLDAPQVREVAPERLWGLSPLEDQQLALDRSHGRLGDEAELVGEFEQYFRTTHYSNIPNYDHYGSFDGMYNMERAAKLAQAIRRVSLLEINKALRNVR